MRKTAITLAILLCSIAMTAKVRMPAVFSDHMILQQESSANIWGWADAGKTVTIKASWDKNAKVSVKTGADGKWTAKLATPSFGGPYSIEISDGEKLTINDVMIGEVWVCSGQSNMEMPVKGFGSQYIEGSRDAILRAGSYRDRIRMFTVGRNSTTELQDDCKGAWQQASLTSTPDASAIAYFFAEYVTDALNMPVGILITDWGGSSIEAWMPESVTREALSSVKSKEQIDQQIANRNKAGAQHGAALLYNGMLYPVRGYNAKGFLWYQGCTNLGNSDCYDLMQAAMVKQWRSDWGDTENAMPFYYVLIAPYNYGKPESHQRGFFVENQRHAAKITPNSDCAATETLSDTGDIIHPAKKRDVSAQLAMLALNRTYGLKTGMDVGCPEPQEIKLNGDGNFEITFSNTKMGLEPIKSIADITGFEIAGEDKVFYPARAYFQGGKVTVEKNEQVPSPAAVRYSFRNFPGGNLTNLFGTPVPPFRSDSWSQY